ncbi:hypothetical protein Clacol_002074 [Clathrus columnatus]|uniref:F-box domain-containing protein n=1 Tax=Clathrus columnatus TaxID=1419009 RepID=A0AAV5A3T0_9AGAM|nr:hypothetical protein Clacol_002074 [Clathrus columnatus]
MSQSIHFLPMHKIFCVPEILDEIFAYTSKHTNTVAARVCQIWFTRSIPFIWARVELNDALNVLSPFLSYAALWRPPCAGLFSSKLVILQWQGEADHFNFLVPLLLPTLRVLCISLGKINDSDIMGGLCQTIASRSPLLRSLEIDVPWYEDDNLQVARSLCELVLLLRDLISISIPTHFVTLETFIILSRLPRLEDVLLSHELNMDYVENHLHKKIITADEDSENTLPFPSLFFLSVNDSLNYQGFTITKAFGQGIQLSALNTLSCSPYCESSDEIVAFMESVHIICPNLQSISISGKDCPLARLPWQAIEILLQCPKLDALKVSECTIDMELDNTLTVATNRSLWISIVLPPKNLSIIKHWSLSQKIVRI